MAWLLRLSHGRAPGFLEESAVSATVVLESATLQHHWGGHCLGGGRSGPGFHKLYGCCCCFCLSRRASADCCAFKSAHFCSWVHGSCMLNQCLVHYPPYPGIQPGPCSWRCAAQAGDRISRRKRKCAGWRAFDGTHFVPGCIAAEGLAHGRDHLFSSMPQSWLVTLLAGPNYGRHVYFGQGSAIGRACLRPGVAAQLRLCALGKHMHRVQSAPFLVQFACSLGVLPRAAFTCWSYS